MKYVGKTLLISGIVILLIAALGLYIVDPIAIAFWLCG